MAKNPPILPPDMHYIAALRTLLSTQFATEDEQIKRMRRVREMRQEVRLPQKHKLVQIEVRDPSIADEIARVSAMFSINDPRMSVLASGPGDSKQENATLREKFTEAVLREAGRYSAGPSAFARMVDCNIGDGAAWVKLVPTTDRWEIRYAIKPSQFSKVIEDEEDSSINPMELLEEEASSEGPLDKKMRPKLELVDWGKYNQKVESAKKEAGVPFKLINVDPLTIYPKYEGSDVTEVLEVSERPYSDVFRRYRLKKDSKGNIVDATPEDMGERQAIGTGRTATCTFLEHWDDTWVSYMVLGVNGEGDPTGKIVQQWKHGYGRHPYFFAPGMWMGHWANKKVGWGIAESKRWLVEYRSYLMTVHAQIVARDAFTPLFRKVDPQAPVHIGNPRTPTQDESWTLGTIYQGNPGEELIPVQFPQVAQSLREELALISEMIAKLEPARPKNEIGGDMAGAGFAANTMFAEDRKRYAPQQRSMENCWEEVTRFLWHLIRTKIKEPIWVYRDGDKDSGWVKAGPEDLTEGVTVRWRLSPEQPTAEILKNRYWTERLQNGTASVDMAVEAMGDNPDEVRIGKYLDQMRASPWYMHFLETHILSKVKRGDLLLKAKAAEEAAMTGAVDGPDGMAVEEGGDPNAPGGYGPGSMGTDFVPDMGDKALSAGGSGAAPGTMAPMQTRGAVPGNPSGSQVQNRGGMASVQRLGS